MWAWSKFVDKLEEEEGHRKATLLMHTDPQDSEGPSLHALRNHFGIRKNVVFSTDRVGFDQLNAYYNLADFTINVSHSEGFGLSTLESMMTATPIIAPLTGGQTRQVIDYRDQSENGFALPIEFQSLVGNQMIPFILEDYTSVETMAEKIMNMYLTKKDTIRYDNLCSKVKEYADHEFNYRERIDQWDNLINHTIQTWKTRYNRYKMEIL